MQMTVSDVGLRILGKKRTWRQVADISSDWIQNGSSTLEVESLGRKLRGSKQVTSAQVDSFIRSVCDWGGGSRVYGRLQQLNRENPAQVASGFREIIALLRDKNVDRAEALITMNRIKGLGSPSYASKHLRMLKPEQFVVLDSWIHNKLEVPLNPASYKDFCTACEDAATIMNEHSKIPCPFAKAWRAADVEVAIFQTVRRGA